MFSLAEIHGKRGGGGESSCIRVPLRKTFIAMILFFFSLIFFKTSCCRRENSKLIFFDSPPSPLSLLLLLLEVNRVGGGSFLESIHIDSSVRYKNDSIKNRRRKQKKNRRILLGAGVGSLSSVPYLTSAKHTKRFYSRQSSVLGIQRARCGLSAWFVFPVHYIPGACETTLTYSCLCTCIRPPSLPLSNHSSPFGPNGKSIQPVSRIYCRVGMSNLARIPFFLFKNYCPCYGPIAKRQRVADDFHKSA